MNSSDLIYNALLMGMDLKSACIYAGLSESQISALMADEERMQQYNTLTKQFEYGLLEKLKTVADKQMNMGKETALTWLLERVNPSRWSGKTDDTVIPPEIHISLTSDTPNMEIHEAKDA